MTTVPIPEISGILMDGKHIAIDDYSISKGKGRSASGEKDVFFL